MKKIILLAILIFSVGYSIAQPNNPFNQVGMDFVTSFNIINQDLKDGKINSLNNETLNYYESILPSNISLNDTTAIQIYRETNNKLEVDSVVNNSSYSIEAKNTIKEVMITTQSSLNIDNLKAYLTLKCEEINIDTSHYSVVDKKMLYSQIAIIYNFIPYVSAVSRSSVDNPIPCSADSNIEGACLIVIVGIGYLVGESICGNICGIGGAIIFGVAAIATYVLS